MGTASRRSSPGLIEWLEREPSRFDFFQAIRLLELQAARDDTADGLRPVPLGHDGSDARPEHWLRLAAHVSLSFPRAAIAEVERRATAKADSPSVAKAPSMDWSLRVLRVAVFGLVGPVGVLPQHYTQETLDRSRISDNALRDFFDLFHHRLLSYFYRAWRKYRFFLHFELPEATAHSGRADWENPMHTCLYGLVGMATGHLRNRLLIDDQLLLFYSGHFATRPRAASLEDMLCEHFSVTVRVQALRGAWLTLTDDDQSCLAGDSEANSFCELGKSAFVGARTWVVEDGVRIWLGPLTLQQFRRFLPDPKSDFRILCQFVRRYLGWEADASIRLVLKADEVPACQIGDHEDGSWLGWNCWLLGQSALCDVHDAEFAVIGEPTR
jgi:type VI secretion system protein ImpH